ncbi:MAG: hypothetical protein AABW48_03345 [Nanoarchaeota archaeon]
MRESHLGQITRWANFVRSNPEWREAHNEFINALFDSHEKIIKTLLKTKHGKKKIIKLYGIKNTKGYDWLNHKKTKKMH